jgi:hypothetical protein
VLKNRKKGNGLYLNNLIDKKLMLPNRPLISEDIINYVKKLKINYFRCVFSRDNLPEKLYNIECTIINLDSSSDNDIHWVSYY